MNGNKYITLKRVKELAKGLEEAVKVLTAPDASSTCYRITLYNPDIKGEDSELAVFVGWSDGFDADDEDLYITGARKLGSGDNIGYALCCSVKVRCDVMWCDYDYLDYPRYPDGEVPWCGEDSLPKNANFKAHAEDLLMAYVDLRNGIKKGKLLL